MRNLLVILAGLILSAPAWADDAICPDRPLKGTASCTVPSGTFQVEISAIDWSRQSDQGMRTIDFTIAAPVFKYGLSASTDLELGLTPFERQVTHDSIGRSTVSGIGDSQLRLKQRLTPVDAAIGVALVPWVKLPTAHGDLGNGKVEEGLIVPVDIELPMKAQLNLTPELDRLADADRPGFHTAVSLAAGLTVPFGDRWSVGGELWAQDDRDPAGHVHQASLDAALSFTPIPSTQFDAEVDVGLTHATSDVELVLGVARRF